MTFEEYCTKKKINPVDFQQQAPTRWEEFLKIFQQISPESFTQQKKFLINDLRRRFPIKEAAEEKPRTAGIAKKPVIKAAPKVKKPE